MKKFSAVIQTYCKKAQKKNTTRNSNKGKGEVLI